MINSIVVDDEKNILEEIKDILEEIDYIKVVEATSDPRQALDIIKNNDIQLAFLDIEMPGINGLELAEKITTMKPDIEIVFITAYNQYAFEAFEKNAIGYLLKPIREERIKRTVEKVLKIVKEETKNKNLLKITTFNKFSISIGTKVIKWRTLKDCEVFAYLVENVDIPLHKEKIIEDIWGDIDVKNGLVYLQSTIYRIRKILGEAGFEDAITYGNNCYTMKYINVDCDIWDYRKYTNKSYEINHENIKLFEHLLEICTGDYLGEDGYSWSIDRCEKVRHKYLELIRNISEFYMKEKKFSKAIEFLEKIIAIDPFYNEGIKLLFKAYHCNKDIYTLNKQFNKIKVLYEEEYGINLSQDIIQYYNELT